MYYILKKSFISHLYIGFFLKINTTIESQEANMVHSIKFWN